MKVYISIIATYILLISNSVNAQNWCSPGATWHYEFENWTIVGYYKIAYVSDTSINSISCKKLEKTLYSYNFITLSFDTLNLPSEYTYADSNKVYVYRFNTFYTLYDFSANVGDTLIEPGSNRYSSDGCDSVGAVRVDSVGFMTINGENLRYISVSPISSSHWGWKCQIVEKIGPIINNGIFAPTYLFPFKLDYCGMGTDEVAEGGNLRCYVDSSFQLYLTDNNITCEYIPTSIEELTRIKNRIAIYPNPAEHQITIEPSDNQIYSSVELLNVFGNSLYYEAGQNLQKCTIDISAYPKGLYFVKIQTPKGTKIDKFLKQ